MAEPVNEKNVKPSPQEALAALERATMKPNLPAFGPGDTVKVNVLIREGNRERIQAFTGICIGRSGSGARETCTIRKMSSGIGVERIFPIHSPRIDSFEVVREGHVRRAKLYYLRDRIGKKATRVKAKKRFGIGKEKVAHVSPEIAPDETAVKNVSETQGDATVPQTE